MLRNLSLAIAGTMLAASAAVAASWTATDAFPSSVNDTGPNYAAPTAASPRFIDTTPVRDVTTPSMVSESMPEMTGDLDHPTMGSGATRGAQGGGNVGYPSSVDESMPVMTGGQSHPTHPQR